MSCFLVVFAVDDESSLMNASSILDHLSEEGLLKAVPIILVANKIDLVRNRTISEKGEYIRANSDKNKENLTLCSQREERLP